MTTTKTRRKPRSQSEIATERKSKALERAGTAVLDGKPAKAKRIAAAQKKRETKKPSPRQAAEVLGEAHALEQQITALDLKIDGYKEAYKQAKSQREALLNRLRGEVRDMGQGRLPFGVNAKADPAQTKPAKRDTKETAPATEPEKDSADAPKDVPFAPVDETEKGLEEVTS